jgi:hypothetical protein
MRAAVCLLILFLLAACATPEHRIRKNPELFATYTPEEQAVIREGGVALGFNPDMVTLAQGRPNRIYARETTDGTREVWSYTRTERSYGSDWVDVPVRYRDSEGRVRTRRESVRVTVDQEREVDRLRVEFSDGKVSAIERLQ